MHEVVLGFPKICSYIRHFQALWAMEGHDNTPMGSFGWKPLDDDSLYDA